MCIRDRDPALALDAAAVTAVAEVTGDGYEVTVTARTLAKDVTLLVDRVHAAAWVDRGLVTLLPGESAVFRVRAPGGLDPAAFTTAPVLRSANDLVEGARIPSGAIVGT